MSSERSFRRVKKKKIKVFTSFYLKFEFGLRSDPSITLFLESSNDTVFVYG